MSASGDAARKVADESAAVWQVMILDPQERANILAYLGEYCVHCQAFQSQIVDFTYTAGRCGVCGAEL